jgi:hypothetical protein
MYYVAGLVALTAFMSVLAALGIVHPAFIPVGVALGLAYVVLRRYRDRRWLGKDY